MKYAVLVGGGYSIKEGIEKGLWDKIKSDQIEVYSLNYAYKFMSFTPHRELWVDESFFRTNIADVQRLFEKGADLYTREYPVYKCFKMIKPFKITRNKNEYDKNTNVIFIGTMGLVGLFALSLAVKQNYEKIFLLGYDFGVQKSYDKKTHFYIDQVKQNKIKSSGVFRPQVYIDNNNKPRQGLLDFGVFEEDRTRIFNVSLVSHISYFPIISYDQFFEDIKK